jgi:hypothetical protein
MENVKEADEEKAENKLLSPYMVKIYLETLTTTERIETG